MELSKKKLEAAVYGFNRDWRKLFSKFDADSSGNLDMEEFRRGLRRIARVPTTQLSDGEVKQLFVAIDHGDTGTITEDLFEEFMSRSIDIDEVHQSVVPDLAPDGSSEEAPKETPKKATVDRRSGANIDFRQRKREEAIIAAQSKAGKTRSRGAKPTGESSNTQQPSDQKSAGQTAAVDQEALRDAEAKAEAEAAAARLVAQEAEAAAATARAEAEALAEQTAAAQQEALEAQQEAEAALQLRQQLVQRQAEDEARLKLLHESAAEEEARVAALKEQAAQQQKELQQLEVEQAAAMLNLTSLATRGSLSK